MLENGARRVAVPGEVEESVALGEVLRNGDSTRLRHPVDIVNRICPFSNEHVARRIRRVTVHLEETAIGDEGERALLIRSQVTHERVDCAMHSRCVGDDMGPS